MKREILFRVWNPTIEKFQYWGFKEEISGHQSFLGVSTSNVVSLQYAFENSEQYTGLKDKNGKKIFEGDIVKIDDDWEEYGWAAGEQGKVIFRHAKFCIETSTDPKSYFYFESNSSVKYVEVTSHIHETNK